jgi:hypothetical protein
LEGNVGDKAAQSQEDEAQLLEIDPTQIVQILQIALGFGDGTIVHMQKNNLEYKKDIALSDRKECIVKSATRAICNVQKKLFWMG